MPVQSLARKRPAVLPVMLLLSALCLTSQLALAKPFNNKVKICQKIYLTYPSLERDFYPDRLREKLRLQIGGCQYVQGDVTIRNFGVEPVSQKPIGGNFQKLDTDFLDSIEEIAGRLVIFRVSLDRLTFRNLRVIRGYNLEANDPHYPMEITQVPFPMKLQLPKLTAIKGGNVTLAGDIHPGVYCYLAHRVNWMRLFQSSQVGQQPPQRFQAMRDFPYCSIGAMQCSGECARTSDACGQQANCWSDGPEGCQSNQCDSAVSYRDAWTGAKKFCDRSCLGGCSGGGPDSCHSCRDVNREGSCASRCSPRSDMWFLMPLWQFADHLCVLKCPLPYLDSSSDSICVAQCSDYEIPRLWAYQMGHCVPCADCNAVCDVRWLLLGDSQAQDLQARNCKLWRTKSSLDISTGGLKSAASLKSLEQMRAFYGRLSIKGVDKLGVRNLDFLRNLEFVSDTFTLMMMQVRYLGLARLRYARILGLVHVGGLCRAWYPARRLEKFREIFSVVVQQVTFDEVSEECRRAACDSRCGGRECWGPGPDMCVID